MKKPYRLFKRGKTWYYKLPNEKSFHTTGKTVRSRAEDYVLKILNEGKPLQTGKTLRQFVNAWHFFEWGECRWIQSQHEKADLFHNLLHVNGIVIWISTFCRSGATSCCWIWMVSRSNSGFWV